MVSQDQENTVVRDMVSMDLGETGTDQEEPKEDMVLRYLVCKSLIIYCIWWWLFLVKLGCNVYSY